MTLSPPNFPPFTRDVAIDGLDAGVGQKREKKVRTDLTEWLFGILLPSPSLRRRHSPPPLHLSAREFTKRHIRD